jgi:hypothetical protein
LNPFESNPTEEVTEFFELSNPFSAINGKLLRETSEIVLYDGMVGDNFNPNNVAIQEFEEKIEILFEKTEYNHWEIDYLNLTEILSSIGGYSGALIGILSALTAPCLKK